MREREAAQNKNERNQDRKYRKMQSNGLLCYWCSELMIFLYLPDDRNRWKRTKNRNMNLIDMYPIYFCSLLILLLDCAWYLDISQGSKMQKVWSASARCSRKRNFLRIDEWFVFSRKLEQFRYLFSKNFDEYRIRGTRWNWTNRHRHNCAFEMQIGVGV